MFAPTSGKKNWKNDTETHQMLLAAYRSDTMLHMCAHVFLVGVKYLKKEEQVLKMMNMKNIFNKP